MGKSGLIPGIQVPVTVSKREQITVAIDNTPTGE